jgi:hypothetical protein
VPSDWLPQFDPTRLPHADTIFAAH